MREYYNPATSRYSSCLRYGSSGNDGVTEILSILWGAPGKLLILALWIMTIVACVRCMRKEAPLVPHVAVHVVLTLAVLCLRAWAGSRVSCIGGPATGIWLDFERWLWALVLGLTIFGIPCLIIGEGIAAVAVRVYRERAAQGVAIAPTTWHLVSLGILAFAFILIGMVPTLGLALLVPGGILLSSYMGTPTERTLIVVTALSIAVPSLAVLAHLR